MADNVIELKDIEKIVLKYFSKHKECKILNIGAKDNLIKDFKWIGKIPNIKWYAMDFDTNYVANTEFSFWGDICNCPQVLDNSYDLIYICNVLEHVKEPWNAGNECVRVCKPGGLILASSPFSWYYHQHPVDFWRFTHDGLQYLFEREGKVETLTYGFKDIIWKDKLKQPKAKGLQSLYLGKKK